MDKIRLFLVDDHTLFRESLMSLLQATEDIEVIGEAGDGIQAINKIAELRPDVVLMDIVMPKMGGIPTTRSIKNDHPSIQILALTMYETEQHIVEMLRAGASGYVSKRAPATQLLAAIHAVCNGESFFDTSIARKVLNVCKAHDGKERIEKEDYRHLTVRELELLCLIAEGKTNKEIAELLSLSLHTVQTHRFNLMKKLELHDRSELVRYAIREGLISP